MARKKFAEFTEEEKQKNYRHNIEWRKKQKVVTFTLNPIMDRDIIEFLDESDTPNATLVKQILRAYIAMQSVNVGK